MKMRQRPVSLIRGFGLYSSLKGVERALGLARRLTMKIQIKRLDHVQLCVPFGEEDKAREFYGRTLGLEEIEKPDALKPNGGLWFKIADVQLHIGVEEAQAKSKRHPAFEVENLDGIRKYLTEHGVKTKDETAVPGLSRFSFFDPFGNRIEFMEKV